MALRVKEGVSIRGLQPQLFHAWNVAEELYEQYDADCWLTAGVDGRHGHGSLHYVGYAIDLRIRNLSAGTGIDAEVTTKAGILKVEIQKQLGSEYDVVLESNHFHIEFQPKEPIS